MRFAAACTLVSAPRSGLCASYVCVAPPKPELAVLTALIPAPASGLAPPHGAKPPVPGSVPVPVRWVSFLRPAPSRQSTTLPLSALAPECAASSRAGLSMTPHASPHTNEPSSRRISPHLAWLVAHPPRRSSSRRTGACPRHEGEAGAHTAVAIRFGCPSAHTAVHDPSMGPYPCGCARMSMHSIGRLPLRCTHEHA